MQLVQEFQEQPDLSNLILLFEDYINDLRNSSERDEVKFLGYDNRFPRGLESYMQEQGYESSIHRLTDDFYSQIYLPSKLPEGETHVTAFEFSGLGSFIAREVPVEKIDQYKKQIWNRDERSAPFVNMLKSGGIGFAVGINTACLTSGFNPPPYVIALLMLAPAVAGMIYGANSGDRAQNQIDRDYNVLAEDIEAFELLSSKS